MSKRTYLCGMTNKKEQIPAEVTRYQKEYGFNTSELIASNAMGDIYALSCVDGNGFVLPTGLPVFVIMKDGRARVESGESALKLSKTLFTEE